jgi:DNA modification methylase
LRRFSTNKNNPTPGEHEHLRRYDHLDRVFHSDCRNLLARLPDQSIDFLCNDPMYMVAVKKGPRNVYDWGVEPGQGTAEQYWEYHWPVGEHTDLTIPAMGWHYKHHPCPKPIEEMRFMVEHLSSPGEVVLDPFTGSGTTLVAAKELGRHYLGCDLCRVAKMKLAHPQIR